MPDDTSDGRTAGGSESDPTELFTSRATDPAAGPGRAIPSSSRYLLAAEIARGGNGVVFAARDLALNRDVAVKVLRDELRTLPEVAGRFLEEAHITGQLQHPGVPPVHDLGVLPDGRVFIAMKLIAGRTLSDLIARDRPDVATLIGIFERIAETVAFAHSRGVIHRDLKPGNVMVGMFGEVQVMDWGLAKVLSGSAGDAAASGRSASAPAVESGDGLHTPHSHQTLAGSVLGTPAYMPPEQAHGDVDAVDVRADVFTLGGILCHVLTGEPPYVGTRAAVRALAMTAELGSAYARLDSCGADRELIDLAKRCLRPNPDERPAGADEVVAALAAHRAGVADRLRQAELERAAAAARAIEVRKRWRVQAALGATAVLLVFGAGAVAWWQDRQVGQRQAARDSEAARTREAVTAAAGEAAVALRADDLPTAAAALVRARTRLGDDGPDDLRDYVVALALDADMVEALQFLTDARPTGRRSGLALNTALPRDYAEVFRRYGLDLRAGDPDAMATRVAGSPIRAQLLAGLDAALGRYAFSASEVPPTLLPLLHRVDGDPVRQRVRAAMVTRETGERLALVRALDPKDLTPGFAALVGQQYDLPEADRLRILSAAAERHPGDFRLHELLCLLYLESRAGGRDPAAEDAADTQARILIALRPSSPDGYRLRAQVLRWASRDDEALAAWQAAAERTLFPEEAASIRSQMGALIRKRQGPAAATAFFRAEVDRVPADPYARANLGRSLLADGDAAGAAACLRAAVELRPTEGAFYPSLARALVQQGDSLGAVRVYREAAERVRPRVWVDTAGLAPLLVSLGRYREAVEAQEQLMADFPSPARTVNTRIRFDGACAAALAGTAGGTDPYPSAEWPALRNKALGWLRDDLARWREELDVKPDRTQADIRQRAGQLLAEPTLARVRHSWYLAALPAAEAVEWRAFWAEVRELRDATN